MQQTYNTPGAAPRSTAYVAKGLIGQAQAAAKKAKPKPKQPARRR